MNALFSTVGQVFMVVAAQPDTSVREMATRLGITERTVMRALTELSSSGLVSIRRHGRRNVYDVAERGTVAMGTVEVDLADVVRLARNKQRRSDRGANRGDGRA